MAEFEQTSPTTILADEPVWAPTTVFGSVLTMRHQYEALDTIREWGLWDRFQREGSPVDQRVERDWRIVRAARRWHGDPLRPPASGRFVGGDVAAMRFAVVKDDIVARLSERLDQVNSGRKLVGTPAESAAALDGAAREWLYEATPYFVELSSLVGLVDGDPPDAEDLDELRLPGDVAVFFGGDITIPMELLNADHALAELSDRHRRAQLAERFGDAEWISADDCPASHLTAPTLAVARRQPLRVCGVVLHADADGRLGDMVLWLTVQPENKDRQRSIVYGWLSRSMLRYVAINLAAAVAWGHWSVADLGDGDRLGDDPTSNEFRETMKRGWFRRREPGGGAVDVRVLDVRRTMPAGPERPEPGGGTHASPVTHRRRGYWRRQRVGPRDDWHYERVKIQPVIVNASGGGSDPGVLTVYRLPVPDGVDRRRGGERR